MGEKVFRTYMARRRVMLVAMLICLLFVWLMYWAQGHLVTDIEVFTSYFVMIFMGLGAIICLLFLMFPFCLAISPSHFALKSVFRETTYDWADVSKFDVLELRTRFGVTKFVQFFATGSDEAQGNKPRKYMLPKGLAPTCEELAADLNAYRREFTKGKSSTIDA